jgi:hypothetical protein
MASDESTELENPLTIFDISLGYRRRVTQEEIDNLADFQFMLAVVNSKIDEAREIPQGMGFRLAIFPNRMRDDGVFVAQDLPIEPYEGVRSLGGNKCFPSVPQQGVRIGSQLPHAFAHELVRRWNLCASTSGDNQ